MNIRDQDLAAIQELGYTPEEARFLYIVATHSGYFQPRQYVASNGLAWGKRVQRFTGKLESRGHVTWREYQNMGGVYHLFSKTLYRRIEKTDLRNRRRHSTEYIRTRLLLLDFILENPQHEYFESETDKLAYFCGQRGIPKQVLPVKQYEAASGTSSTLRYFVDKFPLFLDRSAGLSSPVVSLSYVDPGQASLAGFAHHLQNYARLFSCLGDFAFLYIADSTANFVKADECFKSLVRDRAGKDLVQEISAYFKRRQAWELKQYGQLSAEDVESLQGAKERFASQELETLYKSWSTGQVDGNALGRRLGQKYSDVKIEFRTYLVSRRRVRFVDRTPTGEGHFTPLLHGVHHRELHHRRNCNTKKSRDMKNETAGRKFSEREHNKETTMAFIKKPPENVSRTLQLEKPVSELLDEYCRFVDCTADYVANFALRKILARDPEYRKWQASQNVAKGDATKPQSATGKT